MSFFSPHTRSRTLPRNDPKPNTIQRIGASIVEMAAKWSCAVNVLEVCLRVLCQGIPSPTPWLTFIHHKSSVPCRLSRYYTSAVEETPIDSMQSAQLRRMQPEHRAIRWDVVPVRPRNSPVIARGPEPVSRFPNRCQTCPQAFCEDCLPQGEIDAVGDVLPELYV